MEGEGVETLVLGAAGGQRSLLCASLAAWLAVLVCHFWKATKYLVKLDRIILSWFCSYAHKETKMQKGEMSSYSWEQVGAKVKPWFVCLKTYSLLEPLYTVGGNIIGTAVTGNNSTKVPQKNKKCNYHMIQQSLFWVFFERKLNQYLKEIYISTPMLLQH